MRVEGPARQNDRAYPRRIFNENGSLGDSAIVGIYSLRRARLMFRPRGDDGQSHDDSY